MSEWRCANGRVCSFAREPTRTACGGSRGWSSRMAMHRMTLSVDAVWGVMLWAVRIDLAVCFLMYMQALQAARCWRGWIDRLTTGMGMYECG